MPAVITLTLNPALDVHHFVEDPKLGALNRASRSHYSASGKGLNVSKTLSRLGVASTAVMPLGGLFGSTTQSLMGRAAAFYTPDVIPIKGETRCNFKVNSESSGELSEFNDASPSLSGAELEACTKRLLDTAGAGDIAVLAGSLPADVPDSCYAKTITALKGKEVRVMLDSSGGALKEALAAGPQLVKPNRREAEALLERPLKTYGDAVQAAKDIQSLGADTVILSLGARGAVFLARATCLVAHHPPITPVSSNGCGDALLGAYIFGLLEGWDDEERARYALATATARALMENPRFPDPKLVAPRLDEVTVQEEATLNLDEEL